MKTIDNGDKNHCNEAMAFLYRWHCHFTDGMVADTLVGRRSWTVDDDDVQADITVMIGGSH
ncbi:hypothetical protein BLOT_004550 [Blomia tropicalis]|nr:hypothetical protein BLOT_004550 [Blomia tropicalis]